MITYLEGDATQPQGAGGLKLIPHCCNNIGRWGAGFVVALSRRWPGPNGPEAAYRKMYEDNKEDFHKLLGAAQFIPVEDDIQVVNIIGQRGLIGPDNPRPIDYQALECGFRAVGEFAWQNRASIHMPRVGCGLAGGSWARVQSIIHRCIPGGRPVFVYDFPGGTFNP